METSTAMMNRTLDRSDRRIPQGLDVLSERFGDRLLRAEAHRAQHANTVTWLPPAIPEAVLMAERVEDVQAAVAIAAEYRMPVIPFGAGTSLEGHLNAPLGGVSLDLSRMDRLGACRAGDLDITIEAGVTLEMLDGHLRDTGLFFPVDPGARHATLGGMAATRASGTTTVRYGSMRENVLSLDVVLADGSLIKTGSRARKSAAGYDLTHLMIGSEGTLGIITALTLRLRPRPETAIALVVAFPSVNSAVDATVSSLQSGLVLTRIELCDALALSAITAHSGLELPQCRAALFIDLDGTPAAVAEHSRLLGEIGAAHGAQMVGRAEAEDERRRLWRGRHDALWAIKAAKPGKAAVVTDACVPISALGEQVEAAVRQAEDLQLFAPIIGHVGDGNFHAIAMVDPSSASDLECLDQLNDGIARRAIAAGGTCTGEHGIGERKRHLLAVEAGPALPVMSAIKAALDPYGIMNPGKIIS